jgi:hypothetical protein
LCSVLSNWHNNRTSILLGNKYFIGWKQTEMGATESTAKLDSAVAGALVSEYHRSDYASKLNNVAGCTQLYKMFHTQTKLILQGMTMN